MQNWTTAAYLEVFNKLLASDLGAVNFLHNKIAGG